MLILNESGFAIFSVGLLGDYRKYEFEDFESCEKFCEENKDKVLYIMRHENMMFSIEEERN